VLATICTQAQTAASRPVAQRSCRRAAATAVRTAATGRLGRLAAGFIFAMWINVIAAGRAESAGYRGELLGRVHSLWRARVGVRGT